MALGSQENQGFREATVEMEVSPLRALTQCLKHFFDKCFFGTLPGSDPAKYN